MNAPLRAKRQLPAPNRPDCDCATFRIVDAHRLRPCAFLAARVEEVARFRVAGEIKEMWRARRVGDDLRLNASVRHALDGDAPLSEAWRTNANQRHRQPASL